MEKKVIEFRTDKSFAFRAREQKTLEAMMAMYCRAHHGGGDPLCPSCTALAEYSHRRLERCLFGDAKPTCANCVVHCYRSDMRERIRVMMRWAGPRMIFRHPILAFLHKAIDSQRATPLPPRRSPPRG